MLTVIEFYAPEMLQKSMTFRELYATDINEGIGKNRWEKHIVFLFASYFVIKYSGKKQFKGESFHLINIFRSHSVTGESKVAGS